MLKSKSETIQFKPGSGIREFARRLMRGGLNLISTEMQSLELTYAQIGTLMALQRRGAMTVSNVAENTNLSLAAGSHLVNRLVQRGLLERREDPDDRRQKLVTLSDDGKAFLERFSNAQETILRGMFQAVPPEKLERLEATMLEVLSYQDEAMKGELVLK